MAEANPRPRIGEGRIGSSLCAAIGVLSVAAVLCLRYPAFLTTPELRVHYDVELLRLVLAVAMVVAAWLGAIGIVLGGPRLRAAIGLSALFLAMLLGGPYVPTPDFPQPRFYFGLDWLVLDLFFISRCLRAARVGLPTGTAGARAAQPRLEARSHLFRRQPPADRGLPRSLDAFLARDYFVSGDQPLSSLQAHALWPCRRSSASCW